jgi:hypothetical protein
MGSRLPPVLFPPLAGLVPAEPLDAPALVTAGEPAEEASGSASALWELHPAIKSNSAARSTRSALNLLTSRLGDGPHRADQKCKMPREFRAERARLTMRLANRAMGRQMPARFCPVPT